MVCPDFFETDIRCLVAPLFWFKVGKNVKRNGISGRFLVLCITQLFFTDLRYFGLIFCKDIFQGLENGFLFIFRLQIFPESNLSKWQMQWEPYLVGWDDIFQQTGLPWLIPWKVTPTDTKLKVSESDEIPSNGIKLQQQMFLGTKCIHKGISYLLDANLFQI